MNSYSLADFCTALSNHGLVINNHHNISINKLTRIKTKEDSSGQKSGWYCLFDNKNNFYVGIYGNWRHDATYKTWISKKKLSDFERKAFMHNIKQYRDLTVKEKQQELITIKNNFASFSKCLTHPYLKRKQVNIYGDLRVDIAGRLIIPMYNIGGGLVGYQQILPQKPINGLDKYLAKGSITKEAMYFIGLNQDISLNDCGLFLIGEGYATCASVYEALNEELDATTYCAIVTFSVYNLPYVVDKIVEHYPNKSIWLIADNDNKDGSNNIGVDTCRKIKAKHSTNKILIYIPHGEQ